VPDILLIALVAGLLAIDDRAGWQSLLGEPVFSSLIVGLILGAVAPALQVGVVLQLAWLSIGAARGTRRPHTGVGGIVGAASAAMVLAKNEDARTAVVVAAGVLAGMLAAEIGALLARAPGTLRERWLGNFTLPHTATDAARKLALTVMAAALFVGLVDFVLVLLMLPLGERLVELFNARFGTGGAAGARWWLMTVSALGVAAVLRAFGTRVLVRFLAAGAAAVLLIGWLR
jgi:fructoselysine/glucoselysine PTS system EIIC component